MGKIEIGRKLQELRKRAGLTQAEVGARVGKAYQTVASWESGKGEPDADTFMRLCDIYGVTDSIMETFGRKRTTTRIDATPDAPNLAEQNLVTNFRLLNDEGQGYICRQMDYALSQPDYKKGTAEAKKDAG